MKTFKENEIWLWLLLAFITMVLYWITQRDLPLALSLTSLIMMRLARMNKDLNDKTLNHE